MTYYAFFHPTGVEIDLCCFQRSGRRKEPEGCDPNAHLERPHFLDLREATIHPLSDDPEHQEPVVGNGDTSSAVSSVRPKSRLSVSRY